MKQLEMQQEQEERELLEKGGPDGPARSQSGNDLVKAGVTAEEQQKKADLANARSMPGSRRHSNAGKEDADGKRKPGEQMLNTFIFDDDLDSDLQSKFNRISYIDTDADPLAVRLGLGWQVPSDEHGR